MGIRSLHIILSFFLFFSSTGLTINAHFCTGNYKYSSLFVKPTNCCAKVQGHYPSKDSCKDEVNQTPCCQNEANFFKSSQNQNFTDASISEIELPTFQAILPADLFKRTSHQWLDIDYLNYKPPLILKDISILFQVFRC